MNKLSHAMRAITRTLAVLALFVCLACSIGCLGTSNSSSSAAAGSSASSAASSSATSSSASSASSSATASQSSASAQSSASSQSSDNVAYHPEIDYSKYPKIVSHDYSPPDITVEINGEYTSKDEVALYIHLYGTVPPNYISKTKARKAGWVAEEGNLWEVLPGMSIGGGGWNNDDGELPVAEDRNRKYFECDIDYEGGYRNAKRLVYSDDGLVFYTNDHYETFQELY